MRSAKACFPEQLNQRLRIAKPSRLPFPTAERAKVTNTTRIPTSVEIWTPDFAQTVKGFQVLQQNLRAELIKSLFLRALFGFSAFRRDKCIAYTS
jgi:hypothetical protein